MRIFTIASLSCLFLSNNLIAQTLPSGIVMKNIQGGTFTMGSNSLTGSPDQKAAAPEHSVTLSPFSLSEAEITNEQYVAFLNAAYNEGLIEVVTGTAGPDKDKLLVRGTSASSYEGKVLCLRDLKFIRIQLKITWC